jgi:Zn-dependent protease with chaperone function
MRTIIAAALGMALAAPLAAQKSEGPADFVKDSVIYVDGQPVVAGPKTSFKGVKGMAGIRAGFWVKGEGKRRADGVIVATKLEARPNGMDKGEADIIKMSDQAEKAWVDRKMMFEPADSGKINKIGDILDTGPEVDRVRTIMDRLRPAHIPASALRVRVVRTKEWNASAMANGAIWVYTGLMEAMDDNELAIVLGHELAHYTYEHSRRKLTSSKNTWGQILATGGQVAGAMVGGTTGQLAGMAGQLGASALLTGYSREFEDQADRAGLRYVYEGGYDPKQGPALWTKFKEKYGETDQISNFFTGDHSRPTERIKNIEQQLKWHYNR